MVGVPASPSAVFGVCRDALPNWVRPFPTETAWWPTPPTAAIFRSDTHRTFHARRRVRARPVPHARTSSARWSRRTSPAGRFGRPIHTRFPPEPNGFPHIGHAKSICLNFGIAREFAGRCNLRFDDTNPSTEDIRYVEAIRDDVAVARLRLGRGALRQRLLRAAVRVRRGAGRGQGRRTSTRRARRRSARAAAPSRSPGTPSPYPRPLGRGESRPAAPDARRRVPRRRARAPREDRHGASRT